MNEKAHWKRNSEVITSWAPKNWCSWSVVLEKGLLRVPWTARRSKQSILKGISPAEAPILWPPDVKNCLIGKDPDAGKDWRWEKKGTTEDEMIGWHHWLDGQEFEQAPGVGDGQGGLAWYSPWGHKDWYTTEWPNSTRHLVSFLILLYYTNYYYYY